jgi:hypothetical protein
MLRVWLHGWPGGGTQFYESMRITPALRPLKDDVIGNTGATLWLVMGTIAIVPLIACANVTNLLLVRRRGARRWRCASPLGAGSWRLTRGLLLESGSVYSAACSGWESRPRSCAHRIDRPNRTAAPR